jgi:CubicO group peptidase (beta-lactamase class C family)
MRGQHLTYLLAGAIVCIGCGPTFYLGSSVRGHASAFGQENGPTVMAEAGPDARQRVATCKTNLTGRLEDLDVPGVAAAIIKNGRLVCTSAAGMANVEQKRPATADTLFMIASVSKTITATALMQLYEQGKFQLDDDINRYLPFKVSIPESPKSPITFRQLLTHTASISDNISYINCPLSCPYGSSLSPFVTKGADSPISLADLMKGYLTPGGAYYDPIENFDSNPPGTNSEYSNMGIVLAGYLVEVISGVPFDQYCRDHIFAPLGMNKTSWRLAGIDQSILAMPYNKNDSGYIPYGQYGEPDYPDGMLRTSVNELAHFIIAYMQGGQFEGRQILKPTSVQDMLRSQTSLDPSQGFAWYRRARSGGWRVWGHDGADNGAGAKMWFDPVRKVGVILVTNGIWDDDEARSLLASLFRESEGY